MKSLKFIGIIIVSLALCFIEVLNAQEEEKLVPFIYSNEGNDESAINVEDRKSIATAIKARLQELQKQMELSEEKKERDVAVEGDADALRKYMEEYPNGIVVMASIEAPKSIYAKPDDSFVEKWLENGGIMTWLSYYPFRMRGHERIEKKHFGKVFDLGEKEMQKPLIPKEKTKPTALGKRYMPSLESFETFIPVNIAVLDELNFRYEVYGTAGENNEYADPIMFQSPDMKGRFMYTHMNMYTDFADWAKSTMKGGMAEQIGTEIAEFIVNRFSLYSVKPCGKLATTWARIKY